MRGCCWKCSLLQHTLPVLYPPAFSLVQAREDYLVDIEAPD